jgi:hypothetical protein
MTTQNIVKEGQTHQRNKKVKIISENAEKT